MRRDSVGIHTIMLNNTAAVDDRGSTIRPSQVATALLNITLAAPSMFLERNP